MACDKTNKPLILRYDDNDKISGLQQASGISLESVSAVTVSATNYLNIPAVGGITEFSALTDTPGDYGTPGQVLKTDGTQLIWSSDDGGAGGGVTEFSALTDTPAGYGIAGQVVITSGDGIGYSSLPSYSLIDGSVAYTAPVSGQDPTLSNHLSTKSYVDSEITSLVIPTTLVDLEDTPAGYGSNGQVLTTNGSTGATWEDSVAGVSDFSALNDTPDGYGTNGQFVITSGTGIGFSSVNHNDLPGLTTGDPHTQYMDTGATRAFSSPVSGQTPTLASHLTTKGYVDGITDNTVGISVILDGGGAILASGLNAVIGIPVAMDIDAWYILADQSGDVSIDLRKTTYAAYPHDSGDSIVNSNFLTTTSADKNSETSVATAGWTTNSLGTKDFLQFYVTEDSTSITKVTVFLVCSKT